MILTSLTFLLFCIITILIYFLVPKKLQWFVLLLSSIFFLFYNNLRVDTLIYVLLTLMTVYICALLIDKYSNTKKSKWILIGGIVIVLGQLSFLKYTNFLLVTINHIFHLVGKNFEFNFNTRNVPIGVSYYSLIMIGYMVDVYRGLCKSQKNPLKCALLMSYFPILNSGPFIRYPDMENKLYEKHKFNYDNLCRGLIRIFWGLFKILVISQRLAIFVDAVYGNYTTYYGFYIITATIFFTLQLYTNFSGSIDIIMGISKIMGIELPENFRSPFFSKTITELWRNWHITLGAWLKDYVFYPLMKSNIIQKIGTKTKKKFGKKISKKITLYISMLIMWTLIGVWHNGAYTFIIGSGILQFIYMVLEDLLTPIASKVNKKLGINPETFGYKLYQRLRTFLLFSFSMIFFRATSVANAIDIIKYMFVMNPWILLDHTSLYSIGLDVLDFQVMIYSIIVLFIIDYLKLKGNVIDKIFNQNLVTRWIIIYLLIFAVIIFGLYGPGYDSATFIYRQI